MSTIFARALPSLSVEEVARKIADACDPVRVGDDDHLIEVLAGSGVRPDQVDLDRWSEIKAMAAALLPARLAAEVIITRARADAARAFVITVAAGLLIAIARPAFAAGEPIISEEAGAWLFVLIGLVGFVMALAPRRTRIGAGCLESPDQDRHREF